MLPLLSVQDMGLLHVRGGVSYPFRMFVVFPKSSPRPWRCFSLLAMRRKKLRVFSTSVEVFLNYKDTRARKHRLLHVRGGVSGQKGDPD